MLTIEFESLSGHYHATPWNHQVNEGVLEWPPSPWRIIRALIATWHLKAREDVDEDEVKSIAYKLANDLPRYHLPEMTQAHTRHYMPLAKENSSGLIFQAFGYIKDESIIVQWPNVQLTEKEQASFIRLLSKLGFLGRAESWFEARLIENIDKVWNCYPVTNEHQPISSMEIVKVLCSNNEDSFVEWRAQILTKMEARELHRQREKDIEKNKNPRNALSKSMIQRIAAGVPSSLWDVFHCDTAEMKRQGWSQAPGTYWVEYWRGAVRPGVPLKPYRSDQTLPIVARFTVASSVLPRLTDALYEAEKLHQTLVKYSDGISVFTGHDENGVRLNGHLHAHIFPESHDNRGRITHFTVYAPMGFDDQARRALERVRKLWGKKGNDLQLVLIGIGQPADFAGINTLAGACPLFTTSRVWRSRTPFISTRHVRRSRNGKPQRDAFGRVVGSPEHDLLRLLNLQGLNPIEVREIEGTPLGNIARWLEFRTSRKRGSDQRARTLAKGYEIVFKEPVAGPIAVGYGAHLGLGQFQPVFAP